ncbi:hypothetical protein [Conexibacter woesei]|uniref:hypothetical protein n=1 Tax=Conexibacter woesei TaxID=191495 RepID=UPI0004236383|nr:hypothetical protein [Conexibacter woesei]
MSDDICGLRGFASGLAAAALLALMLTCASARAANVAVCAGTESVDYTPALKLATQSGTIANSDAFTCTSNDPGAASGTTANAFPASYSCLGPLGEIGDEGQQTIAWADATTSVIDAALFTDNAVGGQYTFITTGTVTAGKFAGATATETVVLPTLSALQCLTTGIGHVSGPLTMTIAGA